jgi:hypothetical protein
MSSHESVALLKEEMQALEQCSAVLKRKHNLMTTLCRLPDELIVAILRKFQEKKWIPKEYGTFQISGYDQRTDPGIDFFDFDDYDFQWTRMLLVCKHIHAVALGTPQLWARLDCNKSPEWNSMAITRSKFAPLVVILTKRGAPQTSDLVCSSNLHVIWQAQIDFEGIPFWSETITFRSLTVLHAANMDCWTDENAKVLTTLSSRLVELYLHTTRLSTWPQLVWHRLQRFRASSLFSSLDRLADMMFAMPDLKILSTYYIQCLHTPSPMSGSDTSTYTHAKAPNTDSLTPTENTSYMLNFLNQVSIQDSIRNLLALLKHLSRVKPTDYHPCLDLQVFSFVSCKLLVQLLDCLFREYGWVQTSRTALSATLILRPSPS